MAKSSYYTPRCMAFKAAFKGMPALPRLNMNWSHTMDNARTLAVLLTLTSWNGLPSSQPMANSWCTSTIPDVRLMPMVAQSSPRNTHNNNGCSDITNRLTGL